MNKNNVIFLNLLKSYIDFFSLFEQEEPENYILLSNIIFSQYEYFLEDFEEKQNQIEIMNLINKEVFEMDSTDAYTKENMENSTKIEKINKDIIKGFYDRRN